MMLHLMCAGLYPGELSFDDILSSARRWATSRTGLRQYMIGREKYPEPLDPAHHEHFHVFVHFGKCIAAHRSS